jgi:hypothetical protein
VWGSEFTTKAAQYRRGYSAKTAAGLKRNFSDLVRGAALLSGTAEYNLKQPSEEQLCVGG